MVLWYLLVVLCARGIGRWCEGGERWGSRWHVEGEVGLSFKSSCTELTGTLFKCSMTRELDFLSIKPRCIH